MKLRKTFLVLLLLQTLFMLSCSKKNEQLDSIKLSKESTSFLPIESSEKLAIMCNGKWETTADAPWIKLSPTNGEGNGEVEISVEDNLEQTSRTATIRFKSNSTTKVFTVNQEKSDRSITIDKQNIYVDFQNHEEELTIKSTRSWKVSTPTESWISISKAAGTGTESIKITILPSTLVGVERSASLQIISGKEVAMLNVKQEGKPLEFKATDNDIETDSNGGNKTVAINANTSWRVAGDIPQWITLSTKQGDGNAKVNITVAKYDNEEARSATLKVIAFTGDKELGNLSIKVYQAGRPKVNPLRVKDSLALAALYKSAGGEQWKEKWDLSKPISTYHGVKIKDDRVVVINLWNNGLKGTIPNELTELNQLWEIQLGHNELTGKIPEDWSKLTLLTFFKMPYNNLEGTIPTSLARCKHLMELILDENKLTGTIPTELINLELLTNLLLSGNKLEGTIPSFKGSSLAMLHLQENNLTGSIPSSIGNLPQLQYLGLKLNKLSGVVPSKLQRNPHWTEWEKYNLITLQQNGVVLPLK